MPHFDLPLEELREYRSKTTAPLDLDAYWDGAMREAHDRAAPPVFEPYKPEAYGPLEVFDVTFTGALGHPVRAWFLPALVDDSPPLPRDLHRVRRRARPPGRAHAGRRSRVRRARGGHPRTGRHLVGRGDRRSRRRRVGSGGGRGHDPRHPRPRTYYYRRLYVDAVRAVETAAGDDRVDAGRIGVSGFSQGGGLSLATAALLPGTVRLCQADMPYLCDIEHAVTLSSEQPYTELVDYLSQHHEHVETVFRTLSYIDNAVLASRITARSTVSVGLMDMVCPPSTVFAAYNAIQAPKDIAVYPFSTHDLPGHHLERQLEEFAREMS